MKKLLLTAALAVSIALASCADSRVIDGKRYEPYGIANKEEHKDPDIVYRMDAWSVVFSVVFVETLIVPVYIIGWKLWEPVKAKPVEE